MVKTQGSLFPDIVPEEDLKAPANKQQLSFIPALVPSQDIKTKRKNKP